MHSRIVCTGGLCLFSDRMWVTVWALVKWGLGCSSRALRLLLMTPECSHLPAQSVILALILMKLSLGHQIMSSVLRLAWLQCFSYATLLIVVLCCSIFLSPKWHSSCQGNSYCPCPASCNRLHPRYRFQPGVAGFNRAFSTLGLLCPRRRRQG